MDSRVWHRRKLDEGGISGCLYFPTIVLVIWEETRGNAPAIRHSLGVRILLRRL